MTVTHAPIITSLLDNDLYKFTMLQAMLHQFPQTHGVYRFRCRNNKDAAYPLADIKDALEQQLDSLCELRFCQMSWIICATYVLCAQILLIT